MEQLQLRDFKVCHWVSTLPNMKAQVKDDVFEVVEYLEGLCDVIEDICVKVVKLG